MSTAHDDVGRQDDGPEGDGPDREVGSLGEEAARLLDALSGWAGQQVGEVSDGWSGLVDRAGVVAHDLDEHLATGSAECMVCPVCRAVRALRSIDPDVTAHLGAAVGSLAQAAAAFFAPPTRDGAHRAHGPAGGASTGHEPE